VAVLTNGVDVGHYEAELTYFPTRFRRDVDVRRQVDPTLHLRTRTGPGTAPLRIYERR
jgi:hypothetical protein